MKGVGMAKKINRWAIYITLAIPVLCGALWLYGCTIYYYNSSYVSHGSDKVCKVGGDDARKAMVNDCHTIGGAHLSLIWLDVDFFLHDGPPGNFRLHCVRDKKVYSQDFDYYTRGFSQLSNLDLRCVN